MTVRGNKYLESRQKRLLDVFISHSAYPAELAARIGAAASFGYSIYSDVRVGRAGEHVTIPKIKTLSNEIPLSPLADQFRQIGLDELPQLALVRSGVMSVVGSRHLTAENIDKIRAIASQTIAGKNLLAKHDDIVLPAKRGLLSSYGLQAHVMGDEDTLHRLKLDIDDHENASLGRDLYLLRRISRSAMKNELKYGLIEIGSAETPHLKTLTRNNHNE